MPSSLYDNNSDAKTTIVRDADPDPLHAPGQKEILRLAHDPNQGSSSGVMFHCYLLPTDTLTDTCGKGLQKSFFGGKLPCQAFLNPLPLDALFPLIVGEDPLSKSPPPTLQGFAHPFNLNQVDANAEDHPLVSSILHVMRLYPDRRSAIHTC
jgi:hypothetical protein